MAHLWADVVSLVIWLAYLTALLDLGRQSESRAPRRELGRWPMGWRLLVFSMRVVLFAFGVIEAIAIIPAVSRLRWFHAVSIWIAVLWIAAICIRPIVVPALRRITLGKAAAPVLKVRRIRCSRHFASVPAGRLGASHPRRIAAPRRWHLSRQTVLVPRDVRLLQRLMADCVEQARPYLHMRPRTRLAFGLFHGDYEMHLSVANVEMLPGVAPHRAIYEVGSITKLWTASLLADCIERGQLELLTPLSDIFPTRLPPGSSAGDICLADLATHHSGLPRLPSNLLLGGRFLSRFSPYRSNPYRFFDERRLFRFLRRFHAKSNPARQKDYGTYSNLGFDILGHALAKKCGMSLDAALDEHLSRPLGLRSTSLKVRKEMARRLLPGHAFGGRLESNWKTHFGGALGLHSSTEDLVRFLRASFASLERQLQHPALRYALQRRASFAPGLGIGLAWMLPERVPVAWHNGATGGYSSFVGLDLLEPRGLVVLSNDAASVDPLALHLFRSLRERTLP